MIEKLEQQINEIKKDLFLYRNGIVADKLKAIYPAGTQIYGLIQPQFIELSRKYPKDLSLAKKLWGQKNNRDCRILSLYLFPHKEIDEELALDMIKDVKSVEEAEMLAFKVLRSLPFASDLFRNLKDKFEENTPQFYTISMLQKNLGI